MEYRKQQFLTYDDFTRQFACDYAMPLARGGHGEIYRGVDLETNEEIAVKRRLYSVDDNALTLEKEYANTQAVPVNRFVVRYLYYGRYVTPFGTYEFLVMRFYRDGNLTSAALSWATLSVRQQQRFVSEFLLGLSHLHTHGIVHRDIKPENVLLVRYSDPEGIAFRPVIVDFGISKMMTDFPEAARAFVQNSMRIGTVTYMAPEQLRTENIDYNADLWSFGIILYELITNKHMIARKSFPETQREEAYAFWRMASEERFPDDLRTVPQPYQQIIRKCLIVSAEERVQTAQVLLDLLAFQPRIAEAEAAFRRQQWDVVIEALDPIVEQADIPELGTWLQQARMQQAMAQPADEGLAPVSSVIEEAEPIPPIAEPTDINVPEPAAAAPEHKPVPYTAQTELLDEPAEPIFAKRPAATEEYVPLAAEEEPTVAPEADVAGLNVPDDEPVKAAYVPAETQQLPAAEEAIEQAPMADLPAEASEPAQAAVPDRDVPAATEPATGELTEAFAADAVMGNEPDTPRFTAPPVEELPKPDDVPAQKLTKPGKKGPKPAKKIADKPPVNGQPKPEEARQYTEAFADVPSPTGAFPADREAVPTPAPVLPPTAPPRKTMRIPKAATKLPPIKMPRLTNALDSFDIGKVRQRLTLVYAEARKSKNRPLVVGGVVVVLLLLLFTVGPGQTNGAVVQLDPNESYATSLKRFQAYSRTYEKTGELDPYVWAFVHCNPVYDDTLRRLAVRRAEIVATQYELLFGVRSEDTYKLKRLEMSTMSKNQMGWETRPHTLSDENCLPKK